MTTKPSDAPWADGPFPLIRVPAKRPGLIKPDHFYVRAATGMTNAHNAILRGLNAIILQAPNVPSSDQDGYKPRDVKDLLAFVQYWVKMVNHHHFVEETHMFPDLAKFAGDDSLLEGPWHQHGLFQDGIHKLLAYTQATQPHEYRWEGGMKDVVDSFSKHLTDHLYAEIEVFLGFHYLDSDGFKEAWIGTGRAASQADNFWQRMANMYDIYPCVYGCSDRTYEGGHPFPSLHWTVPYTIKYWYALGNGAWRFAPCDWWLTPRPLAFGPPAAQ